MGSMARGPQGRLQMQGLPPPLSYLWTQSSFPHSRTLTTSSLQGGLPLSERGDLLTSLPFFLEVCNPNKDTFGG